MRISELRKLVRDTIRESMNERAADAIPGRVRDEAKKISQGLDKILKLVKGRKVETKAWKLIQKQVKLASPGTPDTRLPTKPSDDYGKQNF